MTKKQPKGKQVKQETVIAYKGFGPDWKCRDFQYALGQEYTHDGKAVACESGFHACEYPLDVFSYYHPAGSKIAVVEQSGDLSRHDGDSKIASSKIKIKAEIDIAGLVKAAIEYTTSRCKPVDPESPTSNSGTRGAASNSGDYGAASNSGDYGAASNSGTRGAASNSGYQGAASNSGDYGAASNSGYQGAASNSGDYGAASNSGTRGAASTTGKHSVAMACGYEGKASASEGCAIFLTERNDDGEILAVFAGIAGRDGIKPDVFYTLKGGQPVEPA